MVSFYIGINSRVIYFFSISKNSIYLCALRYAFWFFADVFLSWASYDPDYRNLKVDYCQGSILLWYGQFRKSPCVGNVLSAADKYKSSCSPPGNIWINIYSLAGNNITAKLH